MEILEVPWLAQRWQLWRGDASSPSQVMKAGSCCAVMKSICENMSTGPAVDQRHWAHGRATSHEGHVVIFMKGALTVTAHLVVIGRWPAWLVVVRRSVVVAVGGRSWSAVVVAIVVVGGRMLSVVACCRWSWQSVVGRGRSWWWGFSHRGQPSSRSVVIVVSRCRSQLSSW